MRTPEPEQGPPDRIARPWGERTPFGPGQRWPVRADAHLADGVDPDAVSWVRSASVLHSNGDALDHAVLDGRIVGSGVAWTTASTGAGSVPRTCTGGRGRGRATG